MVDLPGGVYPVDAASVVLPRDDFSVSEARRYPRLSGITTVPAGLVGTPWGDLQVAGGAEVANLLASSWDELKLHYINVVDAGGGDFTYEVFVRPTEQQQSPTRIVWGHRPGHEPSGEAAAADKLARLKQYAVAHGSLAGDGEGQDLDLRYGAGSLRHAAHGPQAVGRNRAYPGAWVERQRWPSLCFENRWGIAGAVTQAPSEASPMPLRVGGSKRLGFHQTFGSQTPDW